MKIYDFAYAGFYNITMYRKLQYNQLKNTLKKYMKILDIFGNYETEINAAKYFVYLYDEICYSYAAYCSINLESFLKELTKKYNLSQDNYLIKDEQSKNKKIRETDFSATTYFLKIKDKLLLEVNAYKAIFWYGKNVDFSEIKEILELVSTAKKKKKHKRKFYMIASSNRGEHGFIFKKFGIKKIDADIESHYNDDFKEVDTKVKSFLKAEKANGLVLLHGKYGTGKTTYIRSLMNDINKRFIFLPLDMMEAIGSPNFIPFISKYPNAILVLEDAENLLTPRGSGGHGMSKNSLVNLLNLGDGLLADALSLKIICTFNADLKQIDKAILRKGRLVARYEFKELSIDKVKAICEKNSFENIPEKPATLADIYNMDNKDYGELSKEKSVGF